MAMHVLQLGPYPPPEGGISRNMLAIRDELIARGHRCPIIATSRSSRVGDEPDVFRPRSALSLLKLLIWMDFDVLHLHIGGDLTARVMALAFVSSVFGRKKGVLTLHSGAYPQTKEGLAAKHNSIRGMVFRRFSRVIAVSEPIADVFRRYGLDTGRIKIIQPYSLTAPDENIAVPADLADFCESRSPLLLAVGGLEREYEPLFQIEAMKAILTEFPGAGLLIVGGGSMLEQIKEAVAASGYAGNICIAGDVEHAVTLHLIKNSDILLRTTLFDGDAISVREALFLGTPVIATSIGTRPAGVHLIGIGDKRALVEMVRQIVNENRPKQPLSDPHPANIAAVIEIYDQLAGQTGGSA